MLFDPIQIRSLKLRNRVVMAPLTRNRAVEANTPNALMAEYYAQRASAGLIITEGTSPSPNGLGYARIPGLFTAAQVRGWKLVTEAVHTRGGRIVVQLMHTGRVSQLSNLPTGAEVLGASDNTLIGEVHTDAHGLQPYSRPRTMTEVDIRHAVSEYARAAQLAVEAGFDGVEIHAANGYLVEQFLNANVNDRSDAYGGSIAGRSRFALEVVGAAADAIGARRVGIRLSPHGVFNAMSSFPELDAQYLVLASELSRPGLLYLHVLDHSAMGAPAVPVELISRLRAAFDGPLILAGGFDHVRGEETLQGGRADLIAFGRALLANPDLVDRMRRDALLNTPDVATFYSPGAAGYTDYPALAAA